MKKLRGRRDEKTVISGQNTGGKYLGMQKMKSPCQCGTLYAKKYLVKGGRKGISIICSNCKKERYFLPLKINDFILTSRRLLTWNLITDGR